MTARTVAALQQAAASGIEVTFATGRRHDFACQVIDPRRFDPTTMLISSNGAVTSTLAGERQCRLGMPVTTARLLCRMLGRFRGSLIFTFERTGKGALVVEDLEVLDRRIPRWLAANIHEIECCAPLERAFDGSEEPLQAMICGSLREMEEAMGVLRDALDRGAPLEGCLSVHHTEYAARDVSIVDLMPNGCSKGAAITRLAGTLGIDASEIACIGDNMNDIDMLALAGHPVVMQNAPAELLQMARQNGWEITGANDKDGAAKAILRMLKFSPSADSGEVVTTAAANR